MTSQTPSPQFEIPALKKKFVKHVDPMAPGSGTPWEDRRSFGLISAFVRTCWMSLVAPTRLMTRIRRPETPEDANGFVLGCGILWGLSWVIQSLVMFFYYSRQPKLTVNTTAYVFVTAGQFILAIGATWVLLKLYDLMYGKMVTTEGRQPLSGVLIYSVSAYALGPSLLALVPLIGPPAALLGILIVQVLAGVKRLRVRWIEAISATLLTAIVVAGAAAGGYFLGALFCSYALDVQTVVIQAPPPFH